MEKEDLTLETPEVGGSRRAAELSNSGEFTDQIREVAAALREGLQRNDLGIFYDCLRATELPLAPILLQDDPARLFHLSMNLIHELGGISPAAALAVEQHFYMLGAIATVHVGKEDSRLQEPRRALLEAVSRGRLLVANTNSHVHGNQVGSTGTQGRREGDGYRVSGSAAFMSMATQGDLILFVTQVGDKERIAFFSQLKGNPTIEVGPYTFPHAMLDSDTRRVTFLDTPLTRHNVLASSAEVDLGKLFTYTLVWHQGLLGALYLGTARQALEQARQFCTTTRTREGVALAELDSLVTDLGRLALDYQAAWALARQVEHSIAQLARAPEGIEDAFDQATAAKYQGTRCAEQIVTKVRHIVGTRVFAGGHEMERLSQEVAFGPLSLDFNPMIEHRHGRRVLQGRLHNNP